MTQKNGQTASFVVRFTQKIFKDEEGDQNVQWRGKITHVQGDNHKNFTEFADAIKFIQEKLSLLTQASTEDRTEEERDGILRKSLDIWKKLSKNYPKFVLDTIKDPKAQVGHIQEQIQEGLNQVTGEISEKIELDAWRSASKNDYKQIIQVIQQLSDQIATLNEKVDRLSNPKSK